ncbi:MULTISPECIES: response regulator transcription factor [Paenibacillus]|uniref:response regulator transcription factor n=1 Tax=Paenibacillus TaxID=44249 RepID=UPI00203CC02D|nr:response regulator transcription factor [Paenibacillus camelliae]MCM3633790.1 response regulator transcription factor [Paenibacillus camelliae]
MVNILIAEDDEDIAKLIAMHLEQEGYSVVIKQDGLSALNYASSHPVSLIIMDIMMPELDGHQVTKKLREHYTMPIIFLSAKTTDMDKITGLVIGADDYVTKPFNPMELVARVNAQLRRYRMLAQPNPTESTVLERNGLRIDIDARTVQLYDREIELTPKEFDILHLLAQHPKKVFSSENIFVHVWGESYMDSANTVMVHIRTLRKKLGEDKNKWIKTVWGVGYSFNG